MQQHNTGCGMQPVIRDGTCILSNKKTRRREIDRSHCCICHRLFCRACTSACRRLRGGTTPAAPVSVVNVQMDWHRTWGEHAIASDYPLAPLLAPTPLRCDKWIFLLFAAWPEFQTARERVLVWVPRVFSLPANAQRLQLGFCTKIVSCLPS